MKKKISFHINQKLKYNKRTYFVLYIINKNKT